jgi:restriction endonuclease
MEEFREECYFLVDGQECPNPRKATEPFCAEHQSLFASLDNRTLLELAARTQIKMMYVREDKKLTARKDQALIDEFINMFHALEGRGYTREEAIEAFARIDKELGLMDDLLKQMGKDPKWKKFEKIVTGIHILTSEGAEVKFDDHIMGKRSGRNRQIDASIRFKHGLYDYLAIVECKDYGSRVPMEKVEAFHTKMKDVGARHGIMVSPHGFQEGAITTAKFYDIELFTLEEVKSDWTKQIKANVHTLPWPIRIEFDYPDFDTSGMSKEPQPLQYKDFLFYKDQYSPPIPLYELVGNMGNWVAERELKLPCIVESPLNPPLLTRLPRTDFYTPIYGIIVTFEPTRLAIGHEIDMPPKLEKYIYSDLTKERVHEIPADDIPKVE